MKRKYVAPRLPRTFALLLFAAYMAALLKILLIRTSAAAVTTPHAVNLIPFYTIGSYLAVAVTGGATGLRQAFANIAGNVILFIPFGYFLPVFLKKLWGVRPVLLVTSGFSVTIEILQFILHVGSSDIDDVILNTLGGLVGFILLEHISLKNALSRAAYFKIIFLSLFLLSSGFVFAATQYRAQLGIPAVAIGAVSL